MKKEEFDEVDEMHGRAMCRSRRRGMFIKLLTFIFHSFAETGLLQRAFSSVFRRMNGCDLPQCSHVEGVPNLGTLIYKQEVNRWSGSSYTFRFRHPSHVITGIACRPKNKHTPSPEAEVLEGGIGYDHATMKLTPVCGGHWSCVIDILGNQNSDICEKFTKI